MKEEVDETLLTKSLMNTIQRRNLYESSEGEKRRQRVLHQLETVLSAWSKSVWLNSSHNKDKEGEISVNTDVTLITFGSYRLGVHKSKSDIDVLALCPHYISRDDFFRGSLVSTLHNDPRVTDLHPIPGAYTPVIKFYFETVAIDLLFAQVGIDHAMPLRPNRRKRREERRDDDEKEDDDEMMGCWEEAELDDCHLIGLDESDLRSLNGVRVGQLLLKLVKNAGAGVDGAGGGCGDTQQQQGDRTFENFRTALITIKEWANSHGLYSNVLGFLGGVNWAILVAKVVQIKPNATPPSLIRLFFRMYARWRWPKPVRLLNMQKISPHPSVEFPCWNNRLNHRDGKDLMPIITPAYPSMNSSYNVQRPQLRRLKEEIDKAEAILDTIFAGTGSWDDLLSPTVQNNANGGPKTSPVVTAMQHSFFWQHVHYLEITIRATNPNNFRSWFGYCESRLRLLINSFESHPDMIGVLECYPYAKFFDRVVDSTGNEVSIGNDVGGSNNKDNNDKIEDCKIFISSFFMALRFARGVEDVDLTPCARKFLTDVNSWPSRVPGMDINIEHKLQKHLPSFVFSAAKDVSSTAPDLVEAIVPSNSSLNKQTKPGSSNFASPISSLHKGKVKRKKLTKHSSEKWQQSYSSSKRIRKELAYDDTVDEV